MEATMPTYRLYLEDGSDAGEYRTAGYGFDVGDVIHLGTSSGYRTPGVTDVLMSAPVSTIAPVGPKVASTRK
jgi:hypothetical protein